MPELQLPCAIGQIETAINASEVDSFGFRTAQLTRACPGCALWTLEKIAITNGARLDYAFNIINLEILVDDYADSDPERPDHTPAPAIVECVQSSE